MKERTGRGIWRQERNGRCDGRRSCYRNRRPVIPRHECRKASRENSYSRPSQPGGDSLCPRGRERDVRNGILQCHARVCDVTQSLSGFLLQASTKQGLHRWWKLLREETPIGLTVQDGSVNIHHRGACKRLPARQRLKQNAAKRPDVGALVGLLPTGLLRAQIGCSPQNDAGLGIPLGEVAESRVCSFAFRGERFRQPEIQQFHSIIRSDLNVVGLEIAVVNSLRVRSLQSFGDLPAKIK